MIRNLIVLFFLIFTLVSNAQRGAVTGSVVNKTNKEPLSDIELNLYLLKKDSSIILYTDDSGNFQVSGLVEDSILLEIDAFNFDIYDTLFYLDETKALVDIQLNLIEEIEEVIISGVKHYVKLNGDTIQYNATSYTTHSNATTGQLLDKMPGVDVEGGGVTSQGEKIEQILVDGKPYFGDDPAVVLNNLPAEIISKVEVFDQESEQGNEETTKTLNIVLKEQYKNGGFGKAYVAYGLEGRYNVGGDYSLFNKKERLSIVGQSNNINKQNFSSVNLSGPKTKNKSDFLVPNQLGISTTSAGGFNYQNSFKKLDLNVSYFINDQNIESDRTSRSDFFNEEDFYYSHRSKSRSQNLNHRLNGQLDYKINESSSLKFIPKLSYQLNEGSQQFDLDNFIEDQIVSSSFETKSTTLEAFDFNSRLSYKKQFSKKRRSLAITTIVNLSNTTGDKSLINLLDTDTLYNQISGLHKEVDFFKAGFVFFEPLMKNTTIGIGYGYRKDNSDNELVTNDFSDETETFADYNVNLSNNTHSETSIHNPKLVLKVQNDRVKFKLINLVSLADFNGLQTIPRSNQFNRSYINYLPRFFFQFKQSDSRILRINLRSNTKFPTLIDLAENIDNTNSQIIRIGNNQLDQQVDYNLNAKYSIINPEKGTSYLFSFRGLVSDRYISSSTQFYDETTELDDFTIIAGSQVIQKENLNGYLNLNGLFTYGTPLKKIKSNLGLDIGIGFRTLPSLLSSDKIITKRKSIRLGFKLSSNISKDVDFLIKTTSNYSISSGGSATPIEVYNQTSQMKFNGTIKTNWNFDVKVLHRFTPTSVNLSNNQLAVNFELGRFFFKNKQGFLSLIISDLLNNNQQITQTIDDTSITETSTNILGRYGLLSFRYNFRKSSD